MNASSSIAKLSREQMEARVPTSVRNGQAVAAEELAPQPGAGAGNPAGNQAGNQAGCPLLSLTDDAPCPPTNLSMAMKMLRHGTNTCKLEAAETLCDVAELSTLGVLSKIFDAGAIAPIVSLIRDGVGKQADSALKALSGLVPRQRDCEDSDVEAEHLKMVFNDAVVAAGGVAVFVRLLVNGNASEKLSILAVFYNMLMADKRSDKGLRASIVASGALPPLAFLLGNRSTDDHKWLAAGVVSGLAKNDNYALTQAIVDAGVIPPLVAMLVVGTPDQKENAASATLNLVVTPQIAAVMVAAGAVRPLVRLVASNKTEHHFTFAALALHDIALFGGDDCVWAVANSNSNLFTKAARTISKFRDLLPPEVVSTLLRLLTSTDADVDATEARRQVTRRVRGRWQMAIRSIIKQCRIDAAATAANAAEAARQRAIRKQATDTIKAARAYTARGPSHREPPTKWTIAPLDAADQAKSVAKRAASLDAKAEAMATKRAMDKKKTVHRLEQLRHLHLAAEIGGS